MTVPRCELTGKGPAVKNSVSHSNIKTKSRAFPNIQRKTFFSAHLGRSLRFKAATSAVRDIDKIGSFDVFLLRQDESRLSAGALKIKKKILKKISKKAKKKPAAEPSVARRASEGRSAGQKARPARSIDKASKKGKTDKKTKAGEKP